MSRLIQSTNSLALHLVAASPQERAIFDLKEGHA